MIKYYSLSSWLPWCVLSHLGLLPMLYATQVVLEQSQVCISVTHSFPSFASHLWNGLEGQCPCVPSKVCFDYSSLSTPSLVIFLSFCPDSSLSGTSRWLESHASSYLQSNLPIFEKIRKWSCTKWKKSLSNEYTLPNTWLAMSLLISFPFIFGIAILEESIKE